MMIGELIYWSPARKFGFLEHRTPANGGGYSITKYFVHAVHINFVGAEQISLGLFAIFNPSPNLPRTPKDLRQAEDVELYDSEALARVAMNAKPNSGLQAGLQTLAAPSPKVGA